MLKPQEMSSVIITGSKAMQEAVIRELHSMKIIHIVEHSKSGLADIGVPLENAAKLSEILVRIRALSAALGIKGDKTMLEAKSIPEIDSTAKKIAEELGIYTDELKKIDEFLSKSQASRRELEILKGISIPLESFASYRALAYFTGYIKSREIGSLKKELQKTTQKFMLFESADGGKAFIALFIDAKNKEDANGTLQKLNFSSVSFSSIQGQKGTAAKNLEKLEQESTRLLKRKGEIRKKIEKLAKEHRAFLAASDEFLGEQLEKAEAPLKFASTPSSFLIKGWIPSNDINKSIDRLNKAAKNRIFVHFEPAKKHDKVPVKLKNPAYAKPFEFFLDLYSIPSYREIDPTFFIFLTFPIFFGIMLGDMGYGVVSLAAFLLLRRKMPSTKNFFNILILASLVTVLFGLFFGEFFGYEFMHPVISREHEMFKLLYFSIAIGAIHVNIGLVLGFINELRSHGFMHAIYAKGSWIVLELGIALLALAYFRIILISPFIGAAFLGLSILMLLKGEGVKGLIELPSILTNIMSYARLMAIGLSSVILAVIVNEQAGEFFHKGGFFVLIGIIILVTGHAINIMLGLLGGFLHSLRLHYVEFFSKFFHGGAKKYLPFGSKE
ncbi:V-type ATP synthase subunit I [Candidatus Woesearchaeota archaeon]|nr:V-type ATP synthase subunit I [Candidatus Woesearchaeota archaeon]